MQSNMCLCLQFRVTSSCARLTLSVILKFKEGEKKRPVTEWDATTNVYDTTTNNNNNSCTHMHVQRDRERDVDYLIPNWIKQFINNGSNYSIHARYAISLHSSQLITEITSVCKAVDETNRITRHTSSCAIVL